ncbi:MAG TPA: M20/M25/M40 family metallo-hydrolase [Bryobacteraceae bacterium]|nr:M20/M25/M40 family metallo-hydrolase [Bryobacteraceae bacterium]
MKLKLLVAALPAVCLLAQTNPAAQAARAWRQQHERQVVDEFVALLSIPNIASDRENIRRNADLIVQMMEKRGIAARQVAAPGSNPVVFAEVRTPGAARTLVFYAHYDGQPLDPKEWTTPPFSPVLRSRSIEQDGQVIPLPAPGKPFDPESRLYARSASDDKANVEAILSAWDAIGAAGLKPRANIKFVFEGEEEAGSVNLEKILDANKQLFSGDVWLMCDGPVYQTRQQAIAFGARGIATVNMTIYGARRELHSGHYGNWAPNPAMMLARLLASMKDDNGRVLIDHFYDGIEPLTDSEKRALAEAPNIDADLIRELWLGGTEGAPEKLAELINLPSLNIRGMASSRVGAQASNVIPSTATASIDMRLVKGMDQHQTVARLVDYIRRQGYFVVDAEPTAAERMAHAKVARVTESRNGYNAVRTSMDLPISQDIIRTVESARGPTVKMPTEGGSVPLEMIERALGTRTIGIPIANHDNNQHSFNENLRIQNLWDGIELMAALLTM